MTSVLITGGTGFVGSAIVDAVTEKHPEWSVSVVDLQIPSQPKEKIHYEVADITIAAEMERIFQIVQPVAVIHSAGLVPELASRYNRRAQERVFNVNVTGTRNVLAAAKKTGVKALVWTGSCTAVTDDVRFDYPNIDESWPTSSQSLIYGESKASYSLIVGGQTFLTDSRQLPKRWYLLLMTRNSLPVLSDLPSSLGLETISWCLLFTLVLLRVKHRISLVVDSTCGT